MNKIIYFFKNTFFLSMSTFFLIIFSITFEVKSIDLYPTYDGENVIDMSQKFDSNYISRLKSDLNQSDKEIRVVFLDAKNKVNLSFYAPKLFEAWKMSADSILVVIDPFTNKTGYGIGKNVKEEMKKRQIVNKDEKSKKITNSQKVDYDNLVSAIMDKFSPEQVKVKSKDKDNKKNSSNQSDPSYKTDSDTSKEKVANLPSDNKNMIIILLILVILIIFASIGFYIYNKKMIAKRQEELKTTYYFDADTMQQDINLLSEKINSDIDKMSKYQSITVKKIIPHTEKLEHSTDKTIVYLDKLTNQLEENDIDNLGYLREILDEGNVLKSELEDLHKESVALRKEFKSIKEKSYMSLSDVRVNIENCKNNVEELKLLYGFNLENSEMMITECENLLLESQNSIKAHDPIGFNSIVKNIQSIIKNLKRDFDIIPHLSNQLNENIPLSIEASLEESLIDVAHKNKASREINELRERALSSLSSGDLEHSELLIKNIFDRINEIKKITTKL
ncbi:MAG: hypothetical protein H7263_01170 [Candidatus Sericytochromatia bacterium]|nr:hypothetical protein [Candidatus Sericytochromatia bacterium]